MALAGNMTTAKNRELAFALFVNNVPLEKHADTARTGYWGGRLLRSSRAFFKATAGMK